MKIAHSIFNTPIEIIENKIAVLVIENRNFLQKSIIDLLGISQGRDGEYSFFIMNKEINKNIDVIIDIFNIEVNSTKNLTKLYNQIKSEYIIGDSYNDYINLCNASNLFLTKVTGKFDYALEFDPGFELNSFLKNQSLKFIFDSKSLLEKLVDYLKIMTEFLKTNIFILINIKSYLSEEELILLYEYVFQNKINILLIESEYKDSLKEYENVKIIDKDLDVIN